MRNLLYIAVLGLTIISCGKEEMDDKFLNDTTPSSTTTTPVQPSTTPSSTTTSQYCIEENGSTLCFNTQQELETYLNNQNSQTSTQTQSQVDNFPHHVVEVVGNGDYIVHEYNEETKTFIIEMLPAEGSIFVEMNFGTPNSDNAVRYGTLVIDNTNKPWDGYSGMRIVFGTLVGDVIVTGDNANLVEDYQAIIQEAKALIPAHLSEAIKDTKFSILNDSNMFAFYTADLDRITFSSAFLQADTSFDYLVRTAIHEIGHAVDYKKEITENNAEILALFEDSKADWFNGVIPSTYGTTYAQDLAAGHIQPGDIGHYAHTNVREFFAEMFAGIYGPENDHVLWTPETVEQYENEMFNLITNL